MSDLETIVKLSHEFGTVDYVKGGGGNTSVKNENTLWVKPSGTTLAGLEEETFVAMNRGKDQRALCGGDARRSPPPAKSW